MKRQRRTVGSFVKIDLGKGLWGYARILERSSYAIYDVLAKTEIADLDELAKKSVLFIVAVYDDVVTKGRWLKIGTIPLEEKLKKLLLEFIQDSHNLKDLTIYDPNTGEIKPAKRKECLGLECAAVWEGHHVEERILDHFAKRKNIWFEQLKIK